MLVLRLKLDYSHLLPDLSGDTSPVLMTGSQVSKNAVTHNY